MEIDYFREFLVLVDTKNYWKASERLFIGQSTLSKHIKLMEQELGVPLFTRTSRKVELTSYGNLLIPHAQSITSSKFAYQEQLSIEKDSQNGKFILGTIPSIAQYMITDILANFNKKYPASLIRVIEDDSFNLKELLRQHKCELAFIREIQDAPEEEDLIRHHYIDDKMVAVLPVYHPLAGETVIHLEQLKYEKFILLNQQTQLYKLCIDTCERVGFKPQVTFDCHRLDTILDLVTQGMGVSLLMDRHVRLPRHTGFPNNPAFRVVEVNPTFYTSISLFHCKNSSLSTSAKKFIQYFEDQKNELL